MKQKLSRILRKLCAKTLSVLWSLVLLLLAAGLLLQWLSLSPQGPTPVLGNLLALLLIILAVLTFRENKIAFSLNGLLILVCGTLAVWGFLFKRDPRFLPSAVVSGFGLTYLTLKLWEYKYYNKKTLTLLASAIVLAGGTVAGLCYRCTARLAAIKQIIEQSGVQQPSYGDYSCVLNEVADANLIFLGESPHHTVEIRKTVMELGVYLARQDNARVLGCESLYGLFPFVEAESLGTMEPRHVSKIIHNYNESVSDDQKLLVTALDIEHAIHHSKHHTIEFLTHMANRSSSEEGRTALLEVVPDLASSKKRQEVHAYLDVLETQFDNYQDTFKTKDWEEITFSFQLLRASIEYQMRFGRKRNWFHDRSSYLDIQMIRASYFRKTVERAWAKARARDGKLLCYVGATHAQKTPLSRYDYPLADRTEANYFNEVHPDTKGQVACIFVHAISFKDRSFRRSFDLDDIAYDLMGDNNSFYISLTSLQEKGIKLSWSKYFTQDGPKCDGILFLKDVRRTKRR